MRPRAVRRLASIERPAARTAAFAGDDRRLAYIPAWLIRSRRPFGQLAANFDSENIFRTWVRKASTSGVVTLTPLPSKKPLASASVLSTPASLKALAFA